MLLREDKRELIVLARYRGMKLEAIADLLGIEVGAGQSANSPCGQGAARDFLPTRRKPIMEHENSVGSCPTT